MAVFWVLFGILVGALLYFFFGILFTLYNKLMHRDMYLDAAFDQQPVQRPAWLPPSAWVLNLHAHTRTFEGLLSPEQLVRWHLIHGYNGMVVTDHNTTAGVRAIEATARRLDPSFLVFPGLEYSSERVHLNVIGVREFRLPKFIFWASNRAIRRVIARAHALGGVVQFNHRSWYKTNATPSNQQLYEWGVDGFEVYNGQGHYERAEERFVKKIGSQSPPARPVYASAGVDIHSPEHAARVYTEVLTNDRTLAGFLQALRAGKTRVWACPGDPLEKQRVPPERGFRRTSLDYIRFYRRWRAFTWLSEKMLGRIRLGR